MIVLGGGIIGLTAAWQLLRQGSRQVQAVIESEERPAATDVAAGMLAPISEALPSHKRLMEAGIASLKLYQDFLNQLREETDEAPLLSSKGTLLVADDRRSLAWLQDRFETLQRMQAECSWLGSSELREREPLIGSCAVAAIHIPMEREVLLSKLCKALRISLERQGVELLCKTVTTICEGWRLEFSDDSSTECDELLIASGPWTCKLPLKDPPTITPNKGEVVVAQIDLPLNYMIRTQYAYICPKEDGTVRLGASSAFIGEETIPTIGNLREILQSTWRVLPALDSARFVAAQAGLRPSCNFPVIKRADQKGLYWAVGHGRSGALLAPWTAHKLKQELR